MKNKIKLIPLICCSFISVMGFNALNSSQALQKPDYRQPPTTTNPTPNPAPTPTPYVSFENDTDRMGQDYDRYDTNSAQDCRRSCASESQCRAFTFVPSYHYGQSAQRGRCFLKHSVPGQRYAPGMISGVKQ